jgi:MFS family permease
LPVTFLLFSASTGLSTLGLVGFGVISFHLSQTGMVDLAAVPLVFSLGMLVAAVAALGSGRVYDSVGGAVLLVVPLLTAGVPLLTFSPSLVSVLAGVSLWGAATGIQDSTVKALVADLVAAPRRGTAYGVFAVFQGAGTFAGAALAGALYPDAAALSLVTIPAQALALVLLVVVLRRQRRVARL